MDFRVTMWARSVTPVLSEGPFEIGSYLDV